MKWRSLLGVVLVMPVAFAQPVVKPCRAMLTQADAKVLAAAIPNARAFRENLHATITTSIDAAMPGNRVAIRVVAHQPDTGRTEVVGVYTVDLRTGRVTDDDQEPADDKQTLAVRDRLMAKHCR